MAVEALKRAEEKRAAKSEIRPEKILASEEEMLRRFKKALENTSGARSKMGPNDIVISGAGKLSRKNEVSVVKPARQAYFAPAVSENEQMPEYIE